MNTKKNKEWYKNLVGKEYISSSLMKKRQKIYRQTNYWDPSWEE